MDDALILSATQQWLEKAVIGLNLCPFAKAVHVKKQIRYVVSHAVEVEALHNELRDELQFLRDADSSSVETTLLMHPSVLNDFLDFNDYLDIADLLLKELNVEGVLQIASFHPDYQFFGTESDACENYTNRSPFPTLHLIREDSIARAIDSYPDPDTIFERNIAVLNKLGIQGWRNLFIATNQK